MLTRFKQNREFYISDKFRVLEEKYDGIVYGHEYLDQSGKMRFVAMAFHGKAQKPDWHYYYRTSEDRQRKIDSFFSERKHHFEMITQKKEIKKDFQNPFKVGDILHHSWGYDQTNCDYYQIVEVKKATIVVRPIAARSVPGSQGFMCEYLTPLKDHFCFVRSHSLCENDKPITEENPTITKKVSMSVYNGQVRYHIPVPYGCCDLWDGKPDYSSWYA